MSFEHVYGARITVDPLLRRYAGATPDAAVRVIVVERGSFVKLKRPAGWEDASPGDAFGFAYVHGLSIDDARARLPDLPDVNGEATTALADFLAAPLGPNAVRIAVIDYRSPGFVGSMLLTTRRDRLGRGVA